MDVQGINNFLVAVRLLISQGNIILVPRKKNLDSLAILGITRLQAYDVVKMLTFRDYLAGPKKDYIGDGRDVWEFLKDINEEEVYIKLKLNQEGCLCLSFHIAEMESEKPYKKAKP